MKTKIAIVALCLVWLHALAQTNQVSTNSPARQKFIAPPNEIVTNAISAKPEVPLIINGKVVKTAHLEKVQPDGLLVSYTTTDGSFGVKVFYFRDLPESVRSQYGYDPDKAYEFESAKKSDNESVTRYMIEVDKMDKEHIAQRNAIEAKIEEENRRKRLQERAVAAQEDQALILQQQANQQRRSQEEMNQKLNSIDWNLWNIRWNH